MKPVASQPSVGPVSSSSSAGEESPEQTLYAFVLDIHDGLVQNLFAAASQVHTLQRHLTGNRPIDMTTLEEGLQRIADLLESSLYEIRTFVHAFGSPDIYHRDFTTLVHELAEQRRSITGMQVHVTITPSLPSLPLPTRVALYRILQEALANAHRHGQATDVWVKLACHPPLLTLEIRDNGQGFDPERVLASPHIGKHLGLRGMQERVQALGGTLDITSAPGQGTTIRITLPCSEAESAHEQESTPAPKAHSGRARG